MTIHDRRALRAEAARTLAEIPNQRRLVLLYTGVTALFSLLASLATYLLDRGIAGTGGLSGIGLRSTLDTARQLLSMVISVAMPMWSLGYTHTVLRMSRRQTVRDASLLEGFRRFGPGLRLMLLESLLMSGIFTFCIYLSFFVLGMTPLAEPAYAILEPVLTQVMEDPTRMPDAATTAALMEALMPIFLCGVVLAAVVIIPLSYRLRFSQMRLMDDPRCGARQAMGASMTATRRHCVALFQLDLSFWWYWLLEGLITAIAFGGILLPLVGVSLPVTPEAATLICSLVSTVLQVALYAAFRNRIFVTYALAYDSLMPEQP